VERVKKQRRESRNVGAVWSLPTVLAGSVETSAFIWVSFDIFSKDPSGIVTDGGGLQMRRGLRHRLYAMAACDGMDAA
jgi:hypothetical protein